MNLYIYICLIFFGIILFLLWNHKDKFSIGGQNIDLTQIETQCNNNFTETENYADIGINDRYRCCDTINTKLEQNFDLENMRSSIQTDIENLIDRNIDFQNYDDEKKENIKEFIIGCSYRPRSLKSCNRKNAAISPEMYLDLDLIGSHTGYTFNCINPCNDDNPCLNGGTCINNICDCPEGYGGRLCQLLPPTPTPTPPPPTQPVQSLNPCDSNPCQNDGICEPQEESNEGNNYVCHCENGYTGTDCQISPSPNIFGPLLVGAGVGVGAGLYKTFCAASNELSDSESSGDESEDELLDVSVPGSDSGYTPVSGDETTELTPQTQHYQYLPVGGTGSAPGSRDGG